MTDKSREAFEAWLISTGEYAESQNGVYLSPIANTSWDAWQASRQAIEVDLENVSYVQVEEGTFYLSESDVNESLTSLGIRVKGKAE